MPGIVNKDYDVVWTTKISLKTHFLFVRKSRFFTKEILQKKG
jgi:hypothetical protein